MVQKTIPTLKRSANTGVLDGSRLAEVQTQYFDASNQLAALAESLLPQVCRVTEFQKRKMDALFSSSELINERLIKIHKNQEKNNRKLRKAMAEEKKQEFANTPAQNLKFDMVLPPVAIKKDLHKEEDAGVKKQIEAMKTETNLIKKTLKAEKVEELRKAALLAEWKDAHRSKRNEELKTEILDAKPVDKVMKPSVQGEKVDALSKKQDHCITHAVEAAAVQDTDVVGAEVEEDEEDYVIVEVEDAFDAPDKPWSPPERTGTRSCLMM